MGSSFLIARIRGIDIRVHVLFLLVLLWAGLQWGWVRGLGLAGALYGVLFIILLFVCVTLHEIGHSLVARRFGIRVRDITLLPIGGVAHLEGEPRGPIQELWMALAGPLVNIAIAVGLLPWVVSVLGWRMLEGWAILVAQLRQPTFDRLLADLLLTNVGLALFNLLPAFPMDGGRVLRALLAVQLGELGATRVAVRVGKGLAVMLGFAGLLTGALNLLLVALFIFFAAEQEWQGVRLKSLLAHMPARLATQRLGWALHPHDPLSRAVEIALRTGQMDFPVFEGNMLRGLLTRDELAQAFRKYGPDVPVAWVMRTWVPRVEAGESLYSVQRVLEGSGSPVVFIVQDGYLLGLATRESVRETLRRFSWWQWGAQRV